MLADSADPVCVVYLSSCGKTGIYPVAMADKASLPAALRRCGVRDGDMPLQDEELGDSDDDSDDETGSKAVLRQWNREESRCNLELVDEGAINGDEPVRRYSYRPSEPTLAAEVVNSLNDVAHCKIFVTVVEYPRSAVYADGVLDLALFQSAVTWVAP